MKLPLVALLLVVAGVSSAQSTVPAAAATEAAHRLAGCYRLDDGPWRADSVLAGDVSTLGTPLFFELTDQVAREWAPIQSSERPLFVVRDSIGVLSYYWQYFGAPSETIRIAHPLALAGVTLTLAPDGQNLVGTVEAFTDAIEEGKPSAVSRAVYARRIACPAKVPERGASSGSPGHPSSRTAQWRK